VAGETGVRHVLELYRKEIDRVMALMGARCLNDLGPDCVSFVERMRPPHD
jgi:isopentenyl diphosphate isomerase/L-lactate dehydrogenase-like FMN-dependent dehydrogenase